MSKGDKKLLRGKQLSERHLQIQRRYGSGQVQEKRGRATNTSLFSLASLNFRNVEMNVKKKKKNFQILHDLIRPYFH